VAPRIATGIRESLTAQLARSDRTSRS
jgi:hypothetical protein